MEKISLIPLCNITCESHFPLQLQKPICFVFYMRSKKFPPYKEAIKKFLCKYIKKVGLLHLSTK
jgi:hypothetical protein